jgi:pimeloyl-ACP methyl ester carboxylesterase
VVYNFPISGSTNVAEIAIYTYANGVTEISFEVLDADGLTPLDIVGNDPPGYCPSGINFQAIQATLTATGMTIEGPDILIYPYLSSCAAAVGTISLSISWITPPGNSSLTIVNPFAPYAQNQQAPPALAMDGVLSAPQSISLAADGQSAVVLVYKSQSSEPVTFALSATGAGLSDGAEVGSLGSFVPDYLANPSPANNNLNSLTTGYTYGPDPAGNYYFLALLWAPNGMPVPNIFPVVNINLTATQQGQAEVANASVALEPPPLLLIHGVWSSAAEAGFASGSGGFNDWISLKYPLNYPLNLIYPVNYDVCWTTSAPVPCTTTGSVNLNTQAFSDPRTQGVLSSTMSDALAGAAAAGMAARSVDVVGHSMGGLVARYFLSPAGSAGPASNPALLPNPVHKLITIGTPHQGSALTGKLETDPSPIAASVSLDTVICSAVSTLVSPCNVVNLFNAIGKKVDTAVASMEPGSPQLGMLDPATPYSAIVGLSAVPAQFPLQVTEPVLNSIISGFFPGASIETILGTTSHDTIVSAVSQGGGDPYPVTLPAVVVHANLCGAPYVISLVCPDTGETSSPTFWSQAYWELTGGTGLAPAIVTSDTRRASTAKTTAPLPTLNLTGYTQVAASNVTFLPATGSTLTISSAANITATSSTKTITEVLLVQIVTDPTDTVLLYAVQSPFTISFTPTRLGSASFAAIAVFSDNTYAATTLNYTLQPSGTPYALNLVNVPVANMTVGSSRVIQAEALFTSGPINVTQVATYTALSGSSNVFGTSSGGTITANGNGMDLLSVSYGGLTTTAPIAVGACSYAVNPSNQIVPYTGGLVAIQVTTQPGCSWTASGGAAWLPLANANGSGNGSITLTAAANSSGGTQTAVVTVARLQAAVTQPATACTYGLSQTQINAPAAGTSGTITVTTSCPVIASSNQNWVTVTPQGSSVAYTIAPNNGTSQQNATITIGTQAVSVVQAGTPVAPPAPVLASPANGSTGVSPTASLNWSASGGATSYNVYFGTSSTPPLVTNTAGTSYGPGTLNAGTTYYWQVAAENSGGSIGSAIWSFTTLTSGVSVPNVVGLTQAAATTSITGVGLVVGALTTASSGTVASGSVISESPVAGTAAAAGSAVNLVVSIGTGGSSMLHFVPVTPCRIADTRNADGPFGGPSIGASSSRNFTIPSSPCGIPANAAAYSLNLTVVPLGPLGFLSVWPSGQSQPSVSTLNSSDGRIKANAAIVPAGANGAITVFASDPTNVIVDINGYFVGDPTNQFLAFYPLTPCRIADTRSGSGAFGAPSLAPSVTRSFPIQQSACNVPANAQAYALNMTVVPSGPLGFLSAWPAGNPQPGSSTLNAPTGTVVANAAIVPAGTGGAIDVIATNSTDLLIDINGYFAPAGGVGGLSFYAVTPCRIMDTRGANGTFGGPILAAATARTVPIQSSACNIPSTASAYSLNATVVPPAPLGFLSLWNTGGSQPSVSTLNAYDGSIMSNAAIVPAGTGGAINAFASNLTQLILDINGYFAP